MTRAGVAGLYEVDVVVGFVARQPLLLEPIQSTWTVVVFGSPPLPLFIVWLDMVVVEVVPTKDIID